MIYMAVTADKFELPLYVGKSMSDVASWAGVNRNTVSKNMDKPRSVSKIGMRFVKVEEGNS